MWFEDLRFAATLANHAAAGAVGHGRGAALRARSAQCLEWSAMTQDAYARIGFQSKAGSLSERNFVVRFDQLNLSPVPNVSTFTETGLAMPMA